MEWIFSGNPSHPTDLRRQIERHMAKLRFCVKMSHILYKVDAELLLTTNRTSCLAQGSRKVTRNVLVISSDPCCR